jgi:hypothetical protein
MKTNSSEKEGTMADVKICPICGGEIGEDGFTQTFDGKEKQFCCEGCAWIYEIEYENDLLDDEEYD